MNLEGPLSKETKEKENIKILVDIGCGKYPSLAFNEDWMKEFKKDPSKRYIAIDVNERHLKRGATKLALRTVDTNDRESTYDPEFMDRVSFVLGSGKEIPLKSGSVNEVLLSNVIGDPDVEIDVKRDIIREVERILKVGGKLKIIELYTPDIAEEDRPFVFTYAGRTLKTVRQPQKIKDLYEQGLVKDKDAYLAMFGEDSFIWELEKMENL